MIQQGMATGGIISAWPTQLQMPRAELITIIAANGVVQVADLQVPRGSFGTTGTLIPITAAPAADEILWPVYAVFQLDRNLSVIYGAAPSWNIRRPGSANNYLATSFAPNCTSTAANLATQIGVCLASAMTAQALTATPLGQPLELYQLANVSAGHADDLLTMRLFYSVVKIPP